MGEFLLAGIKTEELKIHTSLEWQLRHLKTGQGIMKLFQLRGAYNCFGLAQVLNTNCNEEQRCLALCGVYSCLSGCKKLNYSSEAHNMVCSLASCTPTVCLI